MGIFLNPGKKAFAEAVRSEIYVDKTGLIQYTNKVLGTTQKCICVSRPRRFGKSIAADMLAAYYGIGCDANDLFQNYSIAKHADYKKHLNNYHVICVDMNSFLYRRDKTTGKAVTPLQAVGLFHTEIIRELKLQFPQSVLEECSDLPAVLAQINEDSGEQFIIIIDEWDSLFREAKQEIEAQEAYMELLRGLFKNAASRKFLKLAYMTGILPIKKYGTESALNNFREFTMIHPGPLSAYVGFTEEEVADLCRRYTMDFEEAKNWYDGYSFQKIAHIYNPNAVVNAMLDGEFQNYWSRTETYESLKNYISMNFDGLKDVIIQLLAGCRCMIDIETFENDMVHFQSKDDVMTVLIHLGYLAYDSAKREVYIPNEEVRSAFVRAIKKCEWNYVIQAIEASDQLLQATWRKDEEAVAKAIDQVHLEHASILKNNDENSLSCVISLAYYHAVNEYHIFREMPAGKGYADLIFLPRRHSDKPAMIVELKHNQSAGHALRQIEEQQYAKALTMYQGELLFVGINYDKKSKTHQCLIQSIQKN